MKELSSEKIKELNEILKLPQDIQQPKLQDFLSKLSEDEIEYLRQKQEQTCPFCSIIFGEIQSNKIYEDQKVMAVLDINPGNLGHFIVFPKEHVKTSFEMKQEEFMYLMNITNLLANKMSTFLKSDGFNIIISNGNNAGQKSEHFLVHCIPRFKDDGISFTWKSKKVDESINQRITKEFNNLMIKEEKQKTNESSNKEYYYEEERIP